MTVLLATNNDHKRRELAAILSGHTVTTPQQLGIDFDFDETGETFLENAMGKARALRDALAADPNAARAASGAGAKPVIVADDSGLCVDALDGGPGIYSARYGSPDGGRTELPSEERNALLLRSIQDARDRNARFVCCMVALFDGERFAVVQETFEGVIARSPSGGGGFGYDPVFHLPDRGMTVAELPDDEKNLISHRGKAAGRLAVLLGAMSGA